MLGELEEKRNELVKQANECRERRNGLNAEASKYSELRNELNKRVKEAGDKAKEFKCLSEEYSEKVLGNKAKRDEFNRKANACYSIVKKRCKSNGTGVDVDTIKVFEQLRRKINSLELKQQIKVLNVDEERQLVAKIAELKKEFNRMQEDLEKDRRLKELLKNAQNHRKEADKYHENFLKFLKLSQECRNKMIESFKEADRLREKADKSHMLFLKAQREADEAHKSFIKLLRDIKDFDRVINGLKRKIYEDRDFREKIDARKEAKEIYDRFKEGEMLDTEDLLTLQKAGML